MQVFVLIREIWEDEQKIIRLRKKHPQQTNPGYMKDIIT